MSFRFIWSLFDFCSIPLEGVFVERVFVSGPPRMAWVTNRNAQFMGIR